MRKRIKVKNEIDSTNRHVVPLNTNVMNVAMTSESIITPQMIISACFVGTLFEK